MKQICISASPSDSDWHLSLSLLLKTKKDFGPRVKQKCELFSLVVRNSLAV